MMNERVQGCIADTLTSCTLLLIIYYVFTFRHYLTSSNIIHHEYQLFIILWYKYELFLVVIY